MTLTKTDIIEIRRLYGNEGMTYREIAKQFGVHHSTIGRIVKTCDPVSKDVRIRKATRGDKCDKKATAIEKGTGSDKNIQRNKEGALASINEAREQYVWMLRRNREKMEEYASIEDELI